MHCSAVRTLAGSQLIRSSGFGTSVGDNDGDGFFGLVCAACARSGAVDHATAEVAVSHDIFTAVVIHPSVGGVAGKGLFRSYRGSVFTTQKKIGETYTNADRTHTFTYARCECRHWQAHCT